MKSYCLLIFLALNALSISSNYCKSSFEFDLNQLNDSQRNRLFDYLDENRDNFISKTEFKSLLKQLFYSTKLNKTLINDSNEENLFNALKFENNLDRNEFNELWQSWIKIILKPKSALIVVDVQNDFIEQKRSLTVANGTQIIPVINKLIEKVPFDVIVYTQDWHPSNHCSFLENAQDGLRHIVKMNKSSIKELKEGDVVYFEKYPEVPQVLWPKHCIKNTYGAQLYKDLVNSQNIIKVYKGTNPDIDSYSAFYDNNKTHKTDLDQKLKEIGITDVYLTGVLYEFCVGSTALDALDLGYRTAFVEDAIQKKNNEKRDEMRHKLIEKSAQLIESDKVLDLVNGRERTVQMGIVLAKKLTNSLLN